MNISASQLWDNLFYFITIALMIELSLSAILSIKFISQLMNNSLLRTIKNGLVLIFAFGLCAKIDGLRFLYGTGVRIPEFIHFIISSLALARMANLIHDFFKYLKQRANTP